MYYKLIVLYACNKLIDIYACNISLYILQASNYL
nr:MAG TPA: hypothetical protein [Caudoviricetes sp.]